MSDDFFSPNQKKGFGIFGYRNPLIFPSRSVRTQNVGQSRFGTSNTGVDVSFSGDSAWHTVLTTTFLVKAVPAYAVGHCAVSLRHSAANAQCQVRMTLGSFEYAAKILLPTAATPTSVAFSGISNNFTTIGTITANLDILSTTAGTITAEANGTQAFTFMHGFVMTSV